MRALRKTLPPAPAGIGINEFLEEHKTPHPPLRRSTEHTCHWQMLFCPKLKKPWLTSNCCEYRNRHRFIINRRWFTISHRRLTAPA